MLKQGKKNKILAETISDILTEVPTSIDPEDDVEDTKAKVTEGSLEDEDDDILVSTFRKQNIDFLADVDKKYLGKKSSRKNLSTEDWTTDEDTRSETDSSGYEEKEKDKSSKNYDDNEDELTSNEDDLENSDDAEDTENSEGTKNSEDGEETENSEDDDSEDEAGNFNSVGDETMIKPISTNDIDGQIRKGTCVVNQLNIWASLLEMRIQLQKCLVATNKMPQKDTFEEIKSQSGAKFNTKFSETKRSVEDLLNKLLQLQFLLLNQYPETKALCNSQVKTENSDAEEIPSDTENEEEMEEMEKSLQPPSKKRKLCDFEIEIRKNHDTYSSYRNSIIQKWNDKTRVGVVKTNNPVHSALNQIDYILSDKQRLIKRTQTKRSNYQIVGKSTSSEIGSAPEHSEETDVEIFDDDDFYLQLLRELIEVKSADITDSVRLGKQWSQLQKMRSKMKHNVDTKATKGRKIRYTVHTKLINFMSQINNNLYTEEAQTELYNSLFGKNQGKT